MRVDHSGFIELGQSHIKGIVDGWMVVTGEDRVSHYLDQGIQEVYALLSQRGGPFLQSTGGLGLLLEGAMQKVLLLSIGAVYLVLCLCITEYLLNVTPSLSIRR